MATFMMELVKWTYLLMLLVWIGFLISLLCSVIRDWFFPEPKHFEQFEEEKDFVPPPGCIALDVSKLEEEHGMDASIDYEDVSDTTPLFNI